MLFSLLQHAAGRLAGKAAFARKTHIYRRMIRAARPWSESSFHRIYHYHVRKTGGTSLNHMFLALGNGDAAALYGELARGPVRAGDRVYVGFDKDLVGQPGYFYAFSHAPADRITLPPSTYTIVCFRDPVSRVVALYSQYANYRDQDVDHPSRAFADVWVKDGFEPFLDRADPAYLFNQLHMFSRDLNPHEAAERAGRVHFVFRTEHFQESITELSKRLNLPLKVLHLRKHSHRFSLSDKDLELARQKMGLEYAFLDRLMGGSPWISSQHP